MTESDRALAEAIPYSSSPSRFLGESSLRDQDSHCEECPPHSPTRAFYLPAGSVYSHQGDSLSDTEESSRRPVDLRGEDLESTGGFQPTSDNVIVYEVYTPPSQDLPLQWHTGKNFLFSEEVCFQITEEKDSPRLEERPRSSVEALALLTYSEEDDDGRISLPPSTRSERNYEVARLQEMYRIATCENDQLRTELTSKVAVTQCKPETASKQTMTSTEDSGETQRIRRENEQLRNTCSLYEQQNSDLRAEIQNCTRDLTNAEKNKGKYTKEIKRLSQLVANYECEMARIAGFVSKISPDLEESWEDRDPRHVSNYLASKAEIISSRHSRLQAIHENTLEECEKLRRELQTCRAALQVQGTESEEAIKQMNGRLKTKEGIIQKLERKLQEKGEMAQKRPRNQTENFASLLRGIAESSTPPRKSTHGAFKVSIDPSDLEDITEKPCIESDEELYASKDRSDTDSHNELNKTETPVQVKRLAWKAKQERRKPPHVRTQSYMQSLLASETRGSVLTYKEALKDLREISSRASRAIEESSLTRQHMKESQLETKSSSLDKRRKPKEVESRAELQSAKEQKGRKYRSPYVAALLKW